MNVLIIEDEPFAQKELKRLLHLCDPHINVISCLDSIEDSVKWLEKNENVDLIMMDIQLSDGLSFEIFNKTEVRAPVIFTTAFDEYAIRAFKVNSIDYLLKPIEEDDLNKALAKFRKMEQEKPGPDNSLSSKQLEQILGLYRTSYKSRLVVRLGDKIQHVDVKNISYFFSEDKVSFIMTNGGKRFIINYTLEQIEAFLDPKDFFRLNRKFLANITAIESVDKYFNSRLRIELDPQTEDVILVSRARVPEFLSWLER